MIKELLIMVACFASGYAVAVYINRKHILKAKRDIKFVNCLKRKSYSRGYKSGVTYARECIKR